MLCSVSVVDPGGHTGSVSIRRIDHVQLAMPAGREDDAVRFYAGLLGVPQVPKPPHLAVRGGCWFERGDLKIHLGVDGNFHPARKAHPTLLVEWFADPVVTTRWNQPAEIKSVQSGYLPRILGTGDPTLMWIVEIDGESAGLFQSYLHTDHSDHDLAVGIADTVGIDHLLGAPHSREPGSNAATSASHRTDHQRLPTRCCG